jgi:hypothetical protein
MLPGNNPIELLKRFIRQFITPVDPEVRPKGRVRPASLHVHKTRAVLKRRRRNKIARASRRANRGR